MLKGKGSSTLLAPFPIEDPLNFLYGLSACVYVLQVCIAPYIDMNDIVQGPTMSIRQESTYADTSDRVYGWMVIASFSLMFCINFINLWESGARFNNVLSCFYGLIA